MSAEAPPRSRTEYLWLAALLIVVVALRFVSLGADPMPELDGGFISDAGTWWKNPRLHAVWGVWTVDDGNYGILTAPAYTVVMRAMFALLGVGYAQAYAANAMSGVLCCLLLYFMVRREHGAPTALLAAALCGINTLTIAYDRSAYPESFQLMMMTAAVSAILGSAGRRAMAALAGLAVVVVLLSKPPGLVLAPIATMTWAAPWLMDRYARGTPRFDLRSFVIFVITAAVVLTGVAVVFLLPHADDVWRHFQIQMSDGAALGARVTERVALFGTRVGYRLNGFFRHEWYLLLPAAAFGAMRVARVVRRPATTVEVASWIWLVAGIGIMGLQTYQQDRRFIFLIPSLAILVSIALAEAIQLGESRWTSPRARRIAMGAAAAVLGAVVFFYAVPFGVWKVIAAGKLVGATWSYSVAGGLLLSGLVLAAALTAMVFVPTLHGRGNASFQRAIAMVPLVVVAARSGSEVSNRNYGLQQTSRTIDRISAGWPASERVAAGWSAGTVTLGSHVLPVNHETKGPTAAERFHPKMEVYAATTGRGVKQTAYWSAAGQPKKVACAQVPIWNDASGSPRLTIHIYVEPDRLSACRAAAVATTSGAQPQ